MVLDSSWPYEIKFEALHIVKTQLFLIALIVINKQCKIYLVNLTFAKKSYWKSSLTSAELRLFSILGLFFFVLYSLKDF